MEEQNKCSSKVGNNKEICCCSNDVLYQCEIGEERKVFIFMHNKLKIKYSFIFDFLLFIIKNGHDIYFLW